MVVGDPTARCFAVGMQEIRLAGRVVGAFAQEL